MTAQLSQTDIRTRPPTITVSIGTSFVILTEEAHGACQIGLEHSTSVPFEREYIEREGLLRQFHNHRGGGWRYRKCQMRRMHGTTRLKPHKHTTRDCWSSSEPFTQVLHSFRATCAYFIPSLSPSFL